jgi:hypothetical protein
MRLETKSKSTHRQLKRHRATSCGGEQGHRTALLAVVRWQLGRGTRCHSCGTPSCCTPLSRVDCYVSRERMARLCESLIDQPEGSAIADRILGDASGEQRCGVFVPRQERSLCAECVRVLLVLAVGDVGKVAASTGDKGTSEGVWTALLALDMQGACAPMQYVLAHGAGTLDVQWVWREAHKRGFQASGISLFDVA